MLIVDQKTNLVGNHIDDWRGHELLKEEHGITLEISQNIKFQTMGVPSNLRFVFSKEVFDHLRPSHMISEVAGDEGKSMSPSELGSQGSGIVSSGSRRESPSKSTMYVRSKI